MNDEHSSFKERVADDEDEIRPLPIEHGDMLQFSQ